MLKKHFQEDYGDERNRRKRDVYESYENTGFHWETFYCLLHMLLSSYPYSFIHSPTHWSMYLNQRLTTSDRAQSSGCNLLFLLRHQTIWIVPGAWDKTWCRIRNSCRTMLSILLGTISPSIGTVTNSEVQTPYLAVKLWFPMSLCDQQVNRPGF